MSKQQECIEELADAAKRNREGETARNCGLLEVKIRERYSNSLVFVKWH